MRKIVLMAVILTMISSSGVFAETTVSHERRTHVAESQSDVKKAPVKENKTVDKKTAENGSAADKKAAESNTVLKDNGQSNVTVKAKTDNEKKNIYHGVSVYMTRNDTEEKYNAALLDAKRNAVEQAGTYIEVHTDMKNFEITNDEVKTLSTAVVRLVPNTIKKQVIANNNGVMEIRVEADFEVNIMGLYNTLSNVKDFNIMTSKFGSDAWICGTYTKYREHSTVMDVSISLNVWYYDDYKKVRHEVRFNAYRGLENDVPVIISKKNPLSLVFYPVIEEATTISMHPIEYEKTEFLTITPDDAINYSNGDTVSLSFSMDTIKSIVNWVNYKVGIRYYEKDGIAKEVIIPERALKKWCEMIVAPQKIVEGN